MRQGGHVQNLTQKKHGLMHKHYTLLQSSWLFFFFTEAAKKHIGLSLKIAMYCKLIIKAGRWNQLPAVKYIYNCKYNISTVEQVNIVLWKCLLYQSAYQNRERENIVLHFSAAWRFVDTENVFLRYRRLRTATEINLLMNERNNFFSNTCKNALLPLIFRRMQLK